MKVILIDLEGKTFWWINKSGIKPLTDFNDSSQATDLTEEEAEIQIEWYSKLGFSLEAKIV